MDTYCDTEPVATSAMQSVDYRQVIQTTLSQLLHEDVDVETRTISIFDTTQDHYQLLEMGWGEQQQRIFLPILHLDIIAGKVWIQENRTDVEIAQLLMQGGIPQQDIVLGFHPPVLRRMGEYAVG
jgi:hypothetical protein